MRFESTSPTVDVFQRRIAFGANERQAVLELTQLALGGELQQSIDGCPVLLEGIGPQQARNGEAHIRHPCNKVLIDGHGFSYATSSHSRERELVCKSRIQCVQAKGALCLFETFANPA